MSVYKELSSQEISYREFFVHKNWQMTENDDVIIMSVHKSTGVFYPSEETKSDGIYFRTMYDSISHLYYHADYILEYTSSNLYSGVLNTKVIANKEPMPYSRITKFYPEAFNFGPNNINNTIYKNLGNQAVVISIPQAYFGDTLKPKSIHVESVTDGFTLNDDGAGNLYDTTESASFSSNPNAFHRGNVFYEHGNVVITSQSSSYQNFGTGSDNVVIKFQGTHKIYELEAYCTVKEGEFNMTMNPSARVSRSLLISEPLSFVTGSDFSTYPTTIGLYNNNGELLVIGKTAQPIRNDSDLAITFVVRLDW